MRHRGQPRRFRPFFTLVLLGLLAGAIMYLRCGDELGLGGGGSAGVGDGDGKGGDVADREADREEPGEKSDVRPAVGSAAARRRCELRLDASGLRLGDSPSTVEKAVTECKEAGGAELTVTGDALFGESEKVRKALKEAGVEVFVREGAVPER